MTRFTIGKRLGIIFLLLYLLLIGSGTVVNYYNDRRMTLRQVRLSSRVIAGEVKAEMARPDIGIAFHSQQRLQRLVNELSRITAYRIDVVSTLGRNPDFGPEERERAVLDYFAGATGREEDTRLVAGAGGTMFQYGSPLRVSAACLACHGDPATAPPAVRNSYPPGDAVFHWKEGQTVGGIFISISMSEILEEARGNAIASVWQRGSIFLLLLLAVHVAIRRYVLAPIEFIVEKVSEASRDGLRQIPLPEHESPEIDAFATAVNTLLDEKSLKIAQHEEAERRYHAAIEFADVPILTMLDQGKIIGCNRSALKLLGTTKHQLIGETFFNFVPEKEEALRWFDLFRETAELGMTRIVKLDVFTATGTHMFNAVFTQIDEQGTCFALRLRNPSWGPD